MIRASGWLFTKRKSFTMHGNMNVNITGVWFRQFGIRVDFMGGETSLPVIGNE